MENNEEKKEVLAEAAAEKPAAAAEPVKKSKKNKKKSITRGCAFVQATYNNTLVNFTDVNGNSLALCSAGQAGFKGPKKATPYAAGLVVKIAADKVKEMGLKDISVFIKGIGSGRDGALRALNAAGFNIVNIQDTTPIPHNGCRPKKPRRL